MATRRGERGAADAGAGVRLVERLASFHLFEPETPNPLEASGEIETHAPTLSHRPRHANEGPVSGYLVLVDGTPRA